jgi:predicted small lipoprotein YifL
MRSFLSRIAVALVLVTRAGCGTSSPLPGPTPQVTQQPQEPTLTGIVRESGTQAPVPNARVCWFYPNCVSTGQDGAYSIVRSGAQGNCPFADGQDFESRQDCVAGLTWNPTLQRIIRIEAGQAIASTIFSDDISGLQLEDYCVACKRIRIVAARSGTLTVRLIPENAGLGLTFAYTDQRANTPFHVQAAQESPVTVLTQAASASRAFELSTTFVPD